MKGRRRCGPPFIREGGRAVLLEGTLPFTSDCWPFVASPAKGPVGERWPSTRTSTPAAPGRTHPRRAVATAALTEGCESVQIMLFWPYAAFSSVPSSLNPLPLGMDQGPTMARARTVAPPLGRNNRRNSWPAFFWTQKRNRVRTVGHPLEVEVAVQMDSQVAHYSGGGVTLARLIRLSFDVVATPRERGDGGSTKIKGLDVI